MREISKCHVICLIHISLICYSHWSLFVSTILIIPPSLWAFLLSRSPWQHRIVTKPKTRINCCSKFVRIFLLYHLSPSPPRNGSDYQYIELKTKDKIIYATVTSTWPSDPRASYMYLC